MGLTVVPGTMIEDGTVTDTNFTNTTITSADMALDPRNASNMSSGSVPLAQLGNVDLTGLEDDTALLGFKAAANGSLAKYNLLDQTVDAFEDASGVDAGSSTNETRDSSGKYYAGTGTGPGDATGGTITYSGGNTIHSFTADGNFITESAATLGSYLVVAGGGGGGGSNGSYGGGGGGAGGYRTATSFAVTAQTYSVSVGAGGTAGAIGAVGTDGGASVFSTITSAGGGGGGGGGTRAGSAGGSGGGSSGNNGGAGAASPAGQGNAGGNSTTSTRIGSGGGGSSAAGTNGSSPAWTIPYDGVAGGNGTASSIIGSSVTYAGGGGSGGFIQTGYSPNSASGGTGGSGGGGAGSSPTQAAEGSPGNGTANLGGGGSGGGGNWAGTGMVGGTGGSGVVILSYTTNSFTNVTYINMTLVSNATTAQAVPTKGDMVMTYTNGAGTAVINTNIKGYVSRDGGTTYTQGTLVTQGTTGGHTIASFHDLDISGQPSGSSMRYKIETLVQSAALATRIQAVSLGWS